MRRPLIAGAAALLVLILMALWSPPARLLPLIIDDSLVLSGVSGSLWHGRAARAAVRSPRGDLHLGELRWSLKPLSILGFAPEVELQTSWGQQRASLRVSSGRGRILLRDVDAVTGAALVAQLLPVRVGGRVNLLFEEVELRDGNPVRADGRVVWQDAYWLSNQGQHPLGSYAAELSSTGDGAIVADIRTIRGPIIAEGAASYNAPTYALNADVSSAAAFHPGLARALSLIASPQENGYLLRLDGELELTR